MHASVNTLSFLSFISLKSYERKPAPEPVMTPFELEQVAAQFDPCILIE